MIKINIYSLIFICSLFVSQLAKAQVYEKGNVIVDAYYGGPNLYTGVVKTFYKADQALGNFANLKYNSIGPVGLKFEYLVGAKIGLGIHANYALTAVEGQSVDGGTTYTYEASYSRLRVMPTLNIHMGNSKRFDPYFSFGVGYASRKFKETTDNPNIPELSIKNASPVAFRAEFGMRYFFTDHIGLNFLVGVGGGPLVGGGLSFKF